MVISRSAFGFFGNILPAGINAVVAGVGWFAVNSVSGALALHALIHGMPKGLCLVIVVIAELLLAFFGHNLVQAFAGYAFLVGAEAIVVFVGASIRVLTKAHPGAQAPSANPRSRCADRRSAPRSVTQRAGTPTPRTTPAT